MACVGLQHRQFNELATEKETAAKKLRDSELQVSTTTTTTTTTTNDLFVLTKRFHVRFHVRYLQHEVKDGQAEKLRLQISNLEEKIKTGDVEREKVKADLVSVKEASDFYTFDCEQTAINTWLLDIYLFHFLPLQEREVQNNVIAKLMVEQASASTSAVGNDNARTVCVQCTELQQKNVELEERCSNLRCYHLPPNMSHVAHYVSTFLSQGYERGSDGHAGKYARHWHW